VEEKATPMKADTTRNAQKITKSLNDTEHSVQSPIKNTTPSLRRNNENSSGNKIIKRKQQFKDNNKAI